MNDTLQTLAKRQKWCNMKEIGRNKNGTKYNIIASGQCQVLNDSPQGECHLKLDYFLIKKYNVEAFINTSKYMCKPKAIKPHKNSFCHSWLTPMNKKRKEVQHSIRTFDLSTWNSFRNYLWCAFRDAYIFCTKCSIVKHCYIQASLQWLRKEYT